MADVEASVEREQRTPEVERAPRRGERAATWVALVIILAVAAVLRFRGIERESLWADEGLTVRILRLPFGEMLQRIRDWEQTPPLYYYVMRAWTAVVGDSEGWLRAPSAVFGVAAVGAVFVLVRRMFGAGAGLAAAALMAVSPYQIAFGQEARAYALLVLLAVMSCDLFVKMLDEKVNGKVEALWVIVTALMLYTHLYGVFVVAAQNLAFLVAMMGRRKRWEDLGRWVALNLLVVVAYGPWLPTVWMWVKSVRAGFWVQPMTLDAITSAYDLYAGSGALLVMCVALAVMGVVGMRKRAGAEVALCAGLLVLPVVVPVVLSVMVKPTFVPRYAIGAAVGLFALAGAGIASIPWRAARVAVGVALVTVSCLLGRGVEPKPQWREAGKFLDEEMAFGDFAAVHRKGATCMYDYYVKRPDVVRIGFDGSALPVTQPLPEGKRIWLVLYTSVFPPREFLQRGHWRVGRQKMFREVLVMELMDATNREISVGVR